jgi:hypothetical protein
MEVNMMQRQIAGAPNWAVGGYWQYVYRPPQVPHTELEMFTQNLEYLVVGQAQPGEEAYHVLFTFYRTVQDPMPTLSFAPTDAIWDGKLVPAIDVPFPLEVGQSRSRTFEVQPENEIIRITITAYVLSLESVAVPGGTFEAFHIQYHENGETYADLWYSPMVQSFVKRTSVVSPMSPRLFPYGLYGLVAGTLLLERMWQFPVRTALDLMFQRLREAAQSRPDLVLPVLQRLIELDIAVPEAQALMSELLSSPGG